MSISNPQFNLKTILPMDNCGVFTDGIIDGAVTSGKLAAGAVTSAAVAPSLIQHVSISVPALDVQSLFSSPYQIVFVTGSQLAILHKGVMDFTAGTDPYTMGGPLFLQSSTSHVALTNSMDSPDITSTTKTNVVAAGSAIGVGVGDGISLTCGTADFVGGNGTLVVDLWYSVI